MSPALVARRLLPLEILLVFLVLVLPWTTPSPGMLDPAEVSRGGLFLAMVIALKANAVVLLFLTLLGTMDATELGHALAHLRVPKKLAHLLLFTVRYLDLLHREYLRLRAAMKVRSFRPRMNRHTYRAYGYLVGMLLVRSFDRAERILAAMKCRGFQGRFYMLDHFAFSRRRDLPFCAAGAALFAILLFLEWL
jgi:cobalt/nickel transport system permease protein